MSFFKARASPQMMGGFAPRPTVSAMRFTASKSPGLAMGKPASMMSTPSLDSCFATWSFSCFSFILGGMCVCGEGSVDRCHSTRLRTHAHTSECTNVRTHARTSAVMVQPGDCSPSRSVVSKILTRFGSRPWFVLLGCVIYCACESVSREGPWVWVDRVSPPLALLLPPVELWSVVRTVSMSCFVGLGTTTSSSMLPTPVAGGLDTVVAIMRGARRAGRC